MLRFAVVFLALSATAALSAPGTNEAGEKASDSGDKVICKRFVRTGSLVDGTRECKTKREWERDRNTMRAPTSEISSCRNSGNGGPC